MAILLKDKNGKSPLHYAVEKNSPKFVEAMLNALNKTPANFQVSKSMQDLFSKLFSLKVKAFERFFNICYF